MRHSTRLDISCSLMFTPSSQFQANLVLVPPVGIGPTSLVSKTRTLSIKLRGQLEKIIAPFVVLDKLIVVVYNGIMYI